MVRFRALSSLKIATVLFVHSLAACAFISLLYVDSSLGWAGIRRTNPDTGIAGDKPDSPLGHYSPNRPAIPILLSIFEFLNLIRSKAFLICANYLLASSSTKSYLNPAVITFMFLTLIRLLSRDYWKLEPWTRKRLSGYPISEVKKSGSLEKLLKRFCSSLYPKRLRCQVLRPFKTREKQLPFRFLWDLYRPFW